MIGDCANGLASLNDLVGGFLFEFFCELTTFVHASSGGSFLPCGVSRVMGAIHREGSIFIGMLFFQVERISAVDRFEKRKRH